MNIAKNAKLQMNTRPFLDFAARVREDCATWLEGMRCPGKPMGYYRFNTHSYHPWSLYAAIGAFAVLKALGRIEQLTAQERQEWADLYLSTYHEPSGRFLCPRLYGSTFHGDPNHFDDLVAADRAAPFKKVGFNLLELGASIPPMRDEGTLGYAGIADLERFFDVEVQRRDPYSYGSVLGGFAHERTLWLLSQNRSLDGDPWIEWFYEYVEKRRDPETGLMTGVSENRMLQMDGLFKALFTMLQNHGRPMPHARKVIDSILDIQHPEGGFGEACEDYNATKLLCGLCIQEQGYRYEQVLEAVTGPVLLRLQSRRRKDGGFSMHTTHCLTHINSIPISDPLPESDVMGTEQQLAVLNKIQYLLVWNT